ncbi:uncharacterized protein LOC110693630 [Chenopodium quinoa]|uniref:uncharacterized protein LOC110693630 n=1 Tax=Chenopodium quinoa TaxID=63459 RepID=UPI000B77C31A|nr:uncharacterized protein LOC110693630 [Chenopodium quinoa]
MVNLVLLMLLMGMRTRGFLGMVGEVATEVVNLIAPELQKLVCYMIMGLKDAMNWEEKSHLPPDEQHNTTKLFGFDSYEDMRNHPFQNKAEPSHSNRSTPIKKPEVAPAERSQPFEKTEVDPAEKRSQLFEKPEEIPVEKAQAFEKPEVAGVSPKSPPKQKSLEDRLLSLESTINVGGVQVPIRLAVSSIAKEVADDTRQEELECRSPRASVGVTVEYRKLSAFQKNVIHFIRRWGENKRKGVCPVPIVIRCDGYEASQKDCYEVLHMNGRVSTGYVGLAAVLYNKKWALKYKGLTKRVMFDHFFAAQVKARKHGLDLLGNRWSKPLSATKTNDVCVVFVPVLEKEHWWCISFALQHKTIWVIDSLFMNALVQHQTTIRELIQAVDVMLHCVDPSWLINDMPLWELKQLEIPQQTDTKVCGVLMLRYVKLCCERFAAKTRTVSIPKARLKLLVEDVFSEENELRLNLQSIIASPSQN